MERVISFDKTLSYPTMKSSSTKLVSTKAMADQRLHQRPLSPKFRVKEGWRDGLLFGIVSKPRQIYLETKVTFELTWVSETAGEADRQRIDANRKESMIFLLILFTRNISPNLIELLGSVNLNLFLFASTDTV